MLWTDTGGCSATAAAAFLTNRWQTGFDTLVVTGSGFTFGERGYDVDDSISYGHVPGMPAGTVAGHAHVFRRLRMNGRNILLCSGRFHLYEGHTPATCGIFIDIASLLGCRRAVLMNAVGGLHPSFAVGDAVLVHDMLDMTFRSAYAQHGWIAPPERTDDWVRDFKQHCLNKGLLVREGTLAQMLGPSYETRAEVRMLRSVGADLVGMSTVIEARRAWQMGIQTIVLSLVTNTLSDTVLPVLDHNDVIHAAQAANQRLEHVLSCALE